METEPDIPDEKTNKAGNIHVKNFMSNSLVDSSNNSYTNNNYNNSNFDNNEK